MGHPSPTEGSPFAHNLRAARRRAGLTQAQLAELTGLETRTIEKMEAGQSKRGVMSENLAALAQALHLGMDDLYRMPADTFEATFVGPAPQRTAQRAA